MPTAQPHLKSCMRCIERHYGRWPCADLEKYRIAFIGHESGWPGCPFMPNAGEIKGWLNGPPAPIEPEANQRLEFLKQMRNANRLGGYLVDGQPDSGGFQSHICVYPSPNRGNESGLFLRRTDNALEILRRIRNVFRGGLSTTQRNQIESSPDLHILPALARTPRHPPCRFIHYPQLRPEDCGIDFNGIEKAWQRGGMLIQVSALDGFHDNLRFFAMLQQGLGRIERAAVAGLLPAHLGPALKALLPTDQLGVQFALQLAKGIALQAGLSLGAAALGSAAGWAIGTFFLPGLGGAAGAAAGGTLATGLYNFILNTFDIVDTGSQIADKNKELNQAALLAWQGRQEEAIEAFAKVFAAILLAVMLALLAKKLADRGKGRKLSKEGEEWVAHQSRQGGGSAPGSKPRPPKRPRLSRAGLRAFSKAQAAEVGMLPEEVAAMAKLAQKGYYIAIRACNKSRLKWLRSGAPINGKPLWLPIKSLNFGDFDGLVGFSGVATRNRGKFKDYPKAIAAMKQVKPGPEFQPAFLKGKPCKGPFELPANQGYDFLYGDPATNKKLLFLKVGDEFLAVDHHGRPFIPDLDVTVIQRRTSAGTYGPPGYNVMGRTDYAHGSDAPDIEGDLNHFFRSEVPYPPGYDPIQHGGRGGSANYMKPIKGGPGGTEFEPVYQRPGWEPGDLEEGHHVVAADGLDGYLGEAMDMSQLKQFHEANPMGPWRW